MADKQKLQQLAEQAKSSGWVYDDEKLNIHEFIIADNERAARIYFKDLVFNDFGRLAYDSKKVKKYNDARYNEKIKKLK